MQKPYLTHPQQLLLYISLHLFCFLGGVDAAAGAAPGRAMKMLEEMKAKVEELYVYGVSRQRSRQQRTRVNKKTGPLLRLHLFNRRGEEEIIQWVEIGVYRCVCVSVSTVYLFFFAHVNENKKKRLNLNFVQW